MVALSLYLLAGRIENRPITNVDKVSGDRGGCGHLGRNEMSPSSTALTSFEISIAGGGAAFAGRKDVWIHPEAHGAAGLTPVEASLEEHSIQPFVFSLRFHLL